MQILPPLVPPASPAVLLGSTPAGPASSALAVVPVHLLVVLTTDDSCGQYIACHCPRLTEQQDQKTAVQTILMAMLLSGWQKLPHPQNLSAMIGQTLQNPNPP